MLYIILNNKSGDTCHKYTEPIPFLSVPTGHVYQDDIRSQSCELEKMLKLYSGDHVQTNMKYKYGTIFQ